MTLAQRRKLQSSSHIPKPQNAGATLIHGPEPHETLVAERCDAAVKANRRICHERESIRSPTEYPIPPSANYPTPKLEVCSLPPLCLGILY